jgi:hypothetical protein
MAASTFLDSLARSAGSDRPAPVFIGGSSRSGTTLLGAMLGSSLEAVTVPEARFKWTLLSSCDAVEDSIDLRCAVRRLAADWKFRQWGVELPPVAALPQDNVRYGALLRCLAVEYAHRSGKDDPGVWLDHTPGNVKYMARLGRLLPDSKFVHIIRDGRAVASSLLPLDWGPNDIFEAAEVWSLKVGMGLAACSALGERAISVRYEDLVYRPEATLKELCDFMAIAYDDEMVARRDFQVPGYTASQHHLVSGVPDPSRAERWRSELSAEQIRAFEYLTGDMLSYLGYALETGMAASKPSRASHVVQMARSTFRKRVSNPVRRSLRRRSSRNR